MLARRLHHQVEPMEIQYEKGYDRDILDGLEAMGHKTKQIPEFGFTSLTAITKVNGRYIGVYDPRRLGSIAYT